MEMNPTQKYNLCIFLVVITGILIASGNMAGAKLFIPLSLPAIATLLPMSKLKWPLLGERSPKKRMTSSSTTRHPRR